MIESYIKKVYAKGIKHKTSQDCPDAEFLASYIDNHLSAAKREIMEQHLLECEDCLTQIIVGTALEEETSALPAKSPIDVVITFLKDTADIITSLTDVVLLPSPAPVMVRGEGDKAMQKARFSRTFAKITAEFTVTKLKQNLGEIKVRIIQDDARLNNIRVNLFHGEKELESHLTENGEAFFDSCRFDTYTITFHRESAPIGSIEIKIEDKPAD